MGVYNIYALKIKLNGDCLFKRVLNSNVFSFKMYEVNDPALHGLVYALFDQDRVI